MEHLEGGKTEDKDWGLTSLKEDVNTVGQNVTQSHTVPGSVGELEDDVIGQVVHLPQPEVVGNVVTVHEGLGDRQKEKQNQNKKILHYKKLHHIT